MEDSGVQAKRSPYDIALFACVISAIGLAVLAIIAARLPTILTTQQILWGFAGCCALSFFASWRRAIVDGRLPSLPTGTPKHDHISGWSFIALAAVVGVIVGLAYWAAADEITDRRIHTDWGLAVVFGLAIAFAVAALLPLILNAMAPNGAQKRIAQLFLPITLLARPFGLLLSFIDSLLVFAVAGGAGAAQPWLLVRYSLLFLSIFPCAVLGYWLPAPCGLIPIVWGFVVAISISRRWAWIEDDREIYMLNHKYSGTHLRIGFAQDLRDEALLSFMSMFFLVPLALRQAHMWSEDLGVPLFQIASGVTPHLLDWIGYYGTELAKAVPFVDWAEIYQVEGAAPIQAESAASRHVVFATRVLVDLVFLAALLQALSILARNAKQMALFEAGVMDRLDPFIEPREFRKLVKRSSDGSWEINGDAIDDFPKYDALRLAELSAPEHHPLSIAAKALRRRDGSDDAARFHEQLLERAFQKKKDADAIEEVLTAIRMTDCPIQFDDMDRVRVELNSRRAMNGVRETLMRLVSTAADSPEKFAVMKSALLGESTFVEGRPRDEVRDAVAPVRRVALLALKGRAMANDAAAIAVIDEVASSDPSGNLRKEAKDILGNIRGSRS